MEGAEEDTTLRSDLSSLFRKIRKDTKEWAEILRVHDIETVEDLLETEIEELAEIFEAADLTWTKDKCNALRAVLKNAAALDLPNNWTFMFRTPKPSSNPGPLSESHSVSSCS